MKILLISSLIFLATLLSFHQNANAVNFEHGYDRPGGELVGKHTGVGSAAQCSQMCSGNGNCVAFTWVKPGIQGPTGVCWLKGSLSKKIANNCCVSGVVRAVQPDMCKWHQKGTTYSCHCKNSRTGKWFMTNASACPKHKPPPRYIDHRKNNCPPGQVWVDGGVFGQGKGYCKTR